MTDDTPHGQVPEALRLAEQYDYGDPIAYSNMWKVAVCTELRRQHTRIAELEAISGRGERPADGHSRPTYSANGMVERPVESTVIQEAK